MSPQQHITSERVLVGDIGGTNARFALVKPGSVELTNVLTLATADFPNIDAAIRCYLEETGAEKVKRACLALACPVEGDTINMTNNHWQFNRQELIATLELDQLKLVNDFTAMALGMLNLKDNELVEVHAGNSMEHAPRLVIGPGTGLGVGGLIPAEKDWYPLSSEGGHVSFAPNGEEEMAILGGFFKRYKRVSVERILSGQGLLELYQVLADLRGEKPVCETPAEITAEALADSNSLSFAALDRFFRILASVVGDQVLTLGARGGVYLCGGILPRVRDLLLSSEFSAHMTNKGRFFGYLNAVPVWLCVAENPGLVGAAAAIDNQEVW